MRIWDIEFGMYSHEIYNLGGLSLSMEIIMLILGMNRGYSGISNQLGMIFGVILWSDFMVISSNIWSSPRIEMDIRLFMG